MKCPNDHTDLKQTKRDGVQMDICPNCKGMWLTRHELAELEDKVFNFGDDEKGSLMLGSSSTNLSCPECAKPMKSFQYRLYDLEMDFCEDGHGYWLTANEDKRVLELMNTEEKNLGRTVLAEDRFAAHLKRLRSGRFLDRMNEWLVDAIDPKTRAK